MKASLSVYYFSPHKTSWPISWLLKKVVYIPKTDDDILPELSTVISQL